MANGTRSAVGRNPNDRNFASTKMQRTKEQTQQKSPPIIKRRTPLAKTSICGVLFSQI
jgi:hypothetical protein